MLFSLRSIVTFCFVVFPVSALASPVFDFSLNYESNTVTFSLTNINVATGPIGLVALGNYATATVNGVGGYNLLTQFYTHVSGASDLFATFSSTPAAANLSSQTFVTSVAEPSATYITTPTVPGYLTYTYLPGTYSLYDYDSQLGRSAATLVITQEAASPVPEPESWILLATGLAGVGLLWRWMDALSTDGRS